MANVSFLMYKNIKQFSVSKNGSEIFLYGTTENKGSTLCMIIIMKYHLMSI